MMAILKNAVFTASGSKHSVFLFSQFVAKLQLVHKPEYGIEHSAIAHRVPSDYKVLRALQSERLSTLFTFSLNTGRAASA